MKYILLFILPFLLIGCQSIPIITCDEQGTIYTRDEMVEMVEMEFIRRGIYPPEIEGGYDNYYIFPKHKEMVRLMNHFTNTVIPTLNLAGGGHRDEIRDCENFAAKVVADTPFYTTPQFPKAAIPIGIILLYMPEPHAIVGWIDDEGCWFIEPQVSRNNAVIWNMDDLVEFKTIFRINSL